MSGSVAAIVVDFRAGRITKAAATWRLMFFARDWREIDAWLSGESPGTDSREREAGRARG